MRTVDMETKHAVRPHTADPAFEDRKRASRERRRMLDPTRDYRLPFVYVGYVWSDTYDAWILCGFVRVKKLRSKGLKKLRRRFTIPDGALFKVQELFVAAACGPGDPPSRRIQS